MMIWGFWKSYQARKRLEAAQYELADRLIREASSLVPSDESESDWALIGGRRSQWGLSRDLWTEEHRQRVQDRAYELYRTNEHARSVIRNLERYIIGPKVAFTPLDDNPVVLQWWQEFESRNRFILKQKEIVRRTFRDGECFIRFFENSDTGRMTLRFIEAQHIQDPMHRFSHGIHTEADDHPDGDVEEIIGYVVSADGTSCTEIPAGQIMHIKVFADSNEKRGNSIFELLGTSIEAYQRWLRDRMVLNRIRSFFGIHRKISHATPGQVASLAAQSAVNRTADRQGRNRQEPMKAGSIITTSDNVELVPIAANLQASDAQYDGRNILLTIAAGCG
ncbi:MAG TPA: phage portal protein, partial [bacterium]|nr:phage portal protein [bacterium]